MESPRTKSPRTTAKSSFGGLAQDQKSLISRAPPYGEIETINVKTDPTPADPEASPSRRQGARGMDKAVAVFRAQHQVEEGAVKKAEAKQGKVYVGKLREMSPRKTGEEPFDLWRHREHEQPFDKTKNEKKTCFITEREDPAEEVAEGGLDDHQGQRGRNQEGYAREPCIPGWEAGFGGRGVEEVRALGADKAPGA